MYSEYDQHDDPRYYEDHIEEATWYADSYPQDVEAITCRKWVETIQAELRTIRTNARDFARMTQGVRA